MDLAHLTSTTAAWIEAWQHGSTHPTVVLASLRRLDERTCHDPRAHAIVGHAQRVMASIPFGSVQEFTG